MHQELFITTATVVMALTGIVNVFILLRSTQMAKEQSLIIDQQTKIMSGQKRALDIQAANLEQLGRDLVNLSKAIEEEQRVRTGTAVLEALISRGRTIPLGDKLSKLIEQWRKGDMSCQYE